MCVDFNDWSPTFRVREWIPLFFFDERFFINFSEQAWLKEYISTFSEDFKQSFFDTIASRINQFGLPENEKLSSPLLSPRSPLPESSELSVAPSFFRARTLRFDSTLMPSIPVVPPSMVAPAQENKALDHDVPVSQHPASGGNLGSLREEARLILARKSVQSESKERLITIGLALINEDPELLHYRILTDCYMVLAKRDWVSRLIDNDRFRHILDKDMMDQFVEFDDCAMQYDVNFSNSQKFRDEDRGLFKKHPLTFC